MPARPLYATANISLHIQPVKQPIGYPSDVFSIGMLIWELGHWQLDNDYIPPCVQLGADWQLSQKCHDYEVKFIKMLEIFPSIVINTDAYPTKSMVELREFVLQLGAFFSAYRFKYQYFHKDGSPFEMIGFWVSVTHQISFLLQCLKDRIGFNTMLMQSTRNRNGVHYTTQSWDEAIQKVVQLKYDHNNLKDAVATIDQFLEMVIPVFTALSSFDGSNAHQQGGEIKGKITHQETW
jgi:hypothetical protein